jgi:hypothetical protein
VTETSTPPASASEARERLLDELARCYARAAVDALLVEQQTPAAGEQEPPLSVVEKMAKERGP